MFFSRLFFFLRYDQCLGLKHDPPGSERIPHSFNFGNVEDEMFYLMGGWGFGENDLGTISGFFFRRSTLGMMYY